MKCEICNNAEAVKVLKGRGEDDERYVCEACAAKVEESQEREDHEDEGFGFPREGDDPAEGDEVPVPAAGDSHAATPAGRTGGETPWLQHAIAMVESHLSDDGYSVEQLANDLCMSRMTFYRKIQSATGQKPTEFMRTIRLRHAADLLRQGQLSITEISYAAGFSSVSYFSRCFRTMYGVPPTLFMGKPDHTPEAGRATTADGLSPSEPFSNDSGTVPR